MTASAGNGPQIAALHCFVQLCEAGDIAGELGQLGDADLLSESSKVYSVLAEALADPARLQGLPAAGLVGEAGYVLQLPRELRSSGVPATVELIIADDVSGAKAELLLSVTIRRAQAQSLLHRADAS